MSRNSKMYRQALLEVLTHTRPVIQYIPRHNTHHIKMNPLNSTIITNPVSHLHNYIHIIPPEGDFKGHDDEKMLKSMYDAISRLKLWEWLKTYQPEEGKGFMWSRAPEISRISNEVISDGHSGSSFAWAMRQMETIAKKGWANYYKDILMN
jgi:hypothetical protein